MSKHFSLKIVFWLVFLFLWVSPTLADMVTDTAWVARFEVTGPISSQVIAVDNSGNVYVTGPYKTIKYDSLGNQLWVGEWGGVDMLLDGSGNAYVLGYGAFGEYKTTKYYANGDLAWQRIYQWPIEVSTYPKAMTRYGSYIYVTGACEINGTTPRDYVYATIKYGQDGYFYWARTYNGAINNDDMAVDIGTDYAGNIYITGYSKRMGEDFDYMTVKYNSSGTPIWVNNYDGHGFGDYPNAMVVDGSGNVYITGKSFNGNSFEYATVKYNSNLTFLWASTYDGPVYYGNDCAYAIALDGHGKVYVTGESYGSGTQNDFVTIKYDGADGDQVWSRRYDGAELDDDGGRAIAVFGSNIYVTGYGAQSSYKPDTSDYTTLRYDRNGNLLEVEKYNGPGNTNDTALAITVDLYGNAYITGTSCGIGTSFDYATVKYFQVERGDVNADGIINLGDVVYLISYLYKGGPVPHPVEAGDCNCDEIVNLGDVVYLISYLYKGGPAPQCP